MLDIYGTLEIKEVLNEIALKTHSELAKQKALSLKMLPSKDEVRKDLALLDEMISLILRHGDLPIKSSFDISHYVDMAQKGGVLTPLDLEHIANDILVADKLNVYFARAEKHLYPLLLSKANELSEILPLEVEIHKVVAPNLSIHDNASEKLLKIRHDIAHLESQIRSSARPLISKYKEFLSEENITIRNDHFVLPVNSIYKYKVDGIIHDVSDSGLTTFIEPSELVAISNKIYLLKADEKEEIFRLLKLLSQKVIKFAPEIIKNNIIISELDFISAKASYASENNSFVAALLDEQIIDIKKARHPLIKQGVVANDFYLDKSQRIIIISGPNAGGKTVALKTLGLMVMMNQMGLALPTISPANLGYFPKIYADIGDNQSLSDNLSTFAAHISNLSTITHFVSSKDLVLLDELGTGTSPSEGEALAIAVTNFLLKHNVFALISSHFEAMKEYAYRHEFVANAMMVFDEKNLLPTYTLKIGYPGRSYGLEMAKRYHLADEVILDAKNSLNKSKKRDVNDVIDKLNKVLHENEKINESIKEKEKRLDSKQKDLAYKEKTLNEKKDNLLESVNEEKERLINETMSKIDDILKQVNKPNVKAHEVIKAKTDLTKLTEDEIELVKTDENIEINDYVTIVSLGLTGKVVKKSGKKLEILTPEGMSVKSDVQNVTKTSEPLDRKVKKSNVDEMLKLKSDVKLELNVIGKHVDEALIEVSKYLDDARLRHFKEVRIIHGMGTGALRKAIHDYLKTLSFVEEFHYGGYFDGGSGATIVKLK